MSDIFRMVQENKPFFDTIQAASSTVSLLGWLTSLGLLLWAWFSGRIMRMSAFGMDVTMRQRDAVVAASKATRARVARDMESAPRQPGQRSVPAPVDLGELRDIIDHAFTPAVANKLNGKAILWVDDNPDNNKFEAEALTKMGILIDQVLSTSAGFAALQRQPYDLVISDMGRGAEKMAGYDLLEAIRNDGNPVPYLLYTAFGSKPEYVADAKQRGAQGSTDHPSQLLAAVIDVLGV